MQVLRIDFFTSSCIVLDNSLISYGTILKLFGATRIFLGEGMGAGSEEREDGGRVERDRTGEEGRTTEHV